MKITRELCGSKLEILIHDEWEFSELIQESLDYWEYFENKYSRFIENNFLYNLNKNKFWEVDEDLYQILTLSNKLSDFSQWYFDITILPYLENNWYGISKEKIPENIWYKNIKFTDNKIELKNNVSIDIWAIWKWFIVDKIYQILGKKIKKFTINFWGDIRTKWKEEVYLEDPINNWKIIWKIELNNWSFASSSGSKRIFWNSHHLISAKSWLSQQNIIWVFVQHNLCSLADSFATTLFVSPIDISLKMLKSIKGLEAMIITKDWNIHKSNWFNFEKIKNEN